MTGVMSRLALPGGETIEFLSPHYLHLPKVLKDGGLKNYEIDTIATAIALVEGAEGDFYDIGSNIGLFSLAVASALKRQCHAYEPFPEAAQVLADIVSQYQYPIEVQARGLGDVAGEATFYLSTRSDMSNSLNPAFRSHRGKLTVPVQTLDDTVQGRAPSLIKIDTETTEVAVVRGGLKTIEKYRPFLIIEVLREELGSEILDLIGKFGYKEYRVDSICVDRSADQHPSHPEDSRNILYSCAPLTSIQCGRIRYWRDVLCGI